QPGRVHIPPGDMGVDVDGARHDNLARRIVGRISTRAHRRLDYPAIAHPNVADLVAIVRWIDDASPGAASQHASPRVPGKAAIIRVITSATEIAPVGFFASTSASVPVDDRCSTAA